jgi:hypothetical protein
MGYEAKKTEHCGPKRGNGAYWGYKWEATRKNPAAFAARTPSARSTPLLPTLTNRASFGNSLQQPTRGADSALADRETSRGLACFLGHVDKFNSSLKPNRLASDVRVPQFSRPGGPIQIFQLILR